MTILLVLIGAAAGALFGPVGLIAGAILGAAFARSIFDDNYELQHSEDEAGFALFDSESFNLQGDDFNINPATGLPMLGGDIGGFDVGGNPYRFDFSDDASVFNSSTFIDTGFSDDMHNSF
jgi:hypothetical protein